ncbi:TetR/AcrR family transcriptional regulator [Xanthomonas citri]|uniref:TetR/AcrR family transcriptional regulator n=1 Tax=Xanthomonas citri TaxID=346 RepID=UPI0018850A9D|nr:TetR/AcrR family transcriptional regulator [Xanthomonas citri]MBE2321189.1 TetR family transcriptional regulator [Solirubrobacter deserti]QOY21880.1 TetR/AcrR family transcriptional regulator [Xanthomonas citri]QQK68022.1 TetR/AcrR family transcriptional regulator [Xanthomonas citri]
MVRHFPGGPRSSEVTRQLILDAAERLCAESGVEALSVRAVCEQAGANVAAVNYHFGSRQNLLEEMFQRRVTPLNEERLQLLDAAIAGPRERLLEGVIQSFISPVIRGIASGARINDQPGGNPSRVVTQFLGRVYSMPGEEEFLKAHYEPVRSRFVLALQLCLPGLPLDDLLWRYNMMVGALIYAMNGPQRMTRRPLVFSNAPADFSAITPESCIRHMTDFLVAGFQAGCRPAEPT